MLSPTELLTKPGEHDIEKWLQQPLSFGSPIEDDDDFYADLEEDDEDDFALEEKEDLDEDEDEDDGGSEKGKHSFDDDDVNLVADENGDKDPD